MLYDLKDAICLANVSMEFSLCASVNILEFIVCRLLRRSSKRSRVQVLLAQDRLPLSHSLRE